MAGLENRDFSAPDETRTPDKTTVDLVNLAGGQISIRHGMTGPNWAPVSACATGNHAIGESMRLIQHGDAEAILCGGTEGEVLAGQVYRIAPGHDAWNAGSEAAVFVEFQGAANYAKG
jgi:3-oxoacyl-(acyl-carrier-protein) synthase